MAALGSRAGNLIYSNRQEDTLNLMGRRITRLQVPTTGVSSSGFLADIQIDILPNGFGVVQLLNTKVSAVENGITGPFRIDVPTVPEFEFVVNQFTASGVSSVAAASQVGSCQFNGQGAGTGILRIDLFPGTGNFVSGAAMGLFPGIIGMFSFK